MKEAAGSGSQISKPDLDGGEVGWDVFGRRHGDRMINAQEWSYSGAIFIGGMEGIFDEAQRFHEAYPDKPMIPLEETGGATRLLMREVDPKERFAWRLT